MKKRRVAHFRVDSFERTEQGALKVRANLTKTGVFSYQLPDGSTLREYRSPEEVFRQEALDSLHGCPATVFHPSEFVTTGNWQFLSVGTVISVERNDPYISGTILVHDSKTIERIESGELKEVSCGYAAGIVPAPEEVEHYDAAQVDLEFNHAAIGPANWGRLGTDVAIRLDSNRELVLPEHYISMRNKKVAVTDSEQEVTESTEEVSEETQETETVEEFDAKASFEALSAKFDSFLERFDAKEESSESDSEEEEAEEASEEEQKTDSEDFDAQVEERANLKVAVRDSHQVLCPGVDPSGKTITELCVEALKTVETDTEGYEEKALIGMLHVAAKSASKASEKVEQKTDEKPTRSFADQLLDNESSAPEKKSFADSLVESVSN